MGIVLDSTKGIPSHPTEEILEDLVFHRLPEALTVEVEEHLLVCESCQDALAETERFVLAMRAAAQKPAPISPVRSGWRTARTSLAPIVALVILGLVVVWKHPQEASLPVAVNLSSLRSQNSLAPAPPAKPLQLNIEAPDLLPGNEYKVEVVDAAGRPVWSGTVSGAGGKLVVQLPQPLGTGVYWVRLYGRGSELLREFGMSVK